MKINVVAVKSGWILTKIAERIVANAPDGVEMVLGPATHNGNNFYIDVTNMYHGHLGGKEIGLFTHVHANDSSNIQEHWWSLDHIIHMSRRSRLKFEDASVVRTLNSSGLKEPKTTHSCKMPGEIPQGFKYNKPTIGIFQRGKYEGKGHHMMMRLAEYPVAADFNWVFVGSGWGEVVDVLKQNTLVINTNDTQAVWPDSYKAFYDMVDYVLIPSKWEGGPMAMIEAAALGKPIIAARVGWVSSELPVDFHFKPGNDEELAAKLRGIVKVRKTARRAVENLSYANYASHVVRCFERIK